MTQDSSPYDNAIAERVNGILKGEFELAETFDSYTQALAKLVIAIDKYNKVRPHASCEMQTPHGSHAEFKIRNNIRLGPIQQNLIINVKQI